LTASRKALGAAIAVAAAGLAIGGSVVYAGGGRGSERLPRGLAPATPAVVGSCFAPKQAFATHGDGNSTTSASFVDIPGATVPFTVGVGSPSTCVTIAFTSMAFAPVDAILLVRAVLDHSTVAHPSDVVLDGDSDEDGDGRTSRSHAMNFVLTGVAPGPHTITMQFASGTAVAGGQIGPPVFIDRGTTVVFSG